MRDVEQRPMRILGVYAHPDDETFCAGGTLAKYTSSGAKAMVISLTRGEAGQIRDAALATRRTLGNRRARELEAACARLGVQHVRCLDFGDGRLKDRPREALLEPVVCAIREFRPDVVLTFDESGAYGHPDHIAASLITTAACLAAGDPAQFPGQLHGGLATHRVQRLYHSCFPKSGHLLLSLLMDWLRGLDRRFRGSEEFIYALMLFADESTMLGYASDRLRIQWYPKGFYIVEQGERVSNLYLILSGSVNLMVEDAAGNVRYVETRGPGEFAGETDVNYDLTHDAHVVAAENTTCLILMPGDPTLYAGRGADAQFTVAEGNGAIEKDSRVTVCIDVTDYVDRKVAALCEYRSQYSLAPGFLPENVLVELLHKEYFMQVLPAKEPESALLPM